MLRKRIRLLLTELIRNDIIKTPIKEKIERPKEVP